MASGASVRPAPASNAAVRVIGPSWGNFEHMSSKVPAVASYFCAS